jgi:hypothetical protein
VVQPERTPQGYGREAFFDNREAFLNSKEAFYDNRYHPRA